MYAFLIYCLVGVFIKGGFIVFHEFTKTPKVPDSLAVGTERLVAFLIMLPLWAPQLCWIIYDEIKQLKQGVKND
jgi:hypothetical protein